MDPAANASEAGGKREQILRVATRLFAEKGYSATGVQEVVTEADCTKPTLYYYFTNKESLYLECIRQALARLEGVVERTFRHRGTVREKLAQVLREYLAFIAEDDTELRLLLSAPRFPVEGLPSIDVRGLEELHLAHYRKLFQAGVASGELRSDLDIDEAVLAFFGMVDHRLLLAGHGLPLPDNYPDIVLDVFMNGVAQ